MGLNLPPPMVVFFYFTNCGIYHEKTKSINMFIFILFICRFPYEDHVKETKHVQKRMPFFKLLPLLSMSPNWESETTCEQEITSQTTEENYRGSLRRESKERAIFGSVLSLDLPTFPFRGYIRRRLGVL